jgi:hypothetical protein
VRDDVDEPVTSVDEAEAAVESTPGRGATPKSPAREDDQQRERRAMD